MTTYQAKTDEVKREWCVIDATDKVVGRLATQVATLLRGKHRPQFTKHIDTGDFVIVTNAEKMRFTGEKGTKKIYFHHTGYVGGIKGISARDLLRKNPEDLLKRAVWGMLPKNALSKKMLMKLKVYAGPNHPHSSQQPKTLTA
ncbi:MAG: 50S ribosomal protein L13 [Deltaproteobacteria bacterium RIFCSPHIGHO2_12_FULL_43_9]|nr:MAG: 50S ribosomal protein L13 [Deltaproteobacteria bacterium RIFCSPHIGHO2_12_FULL_43_9]